MADTIEERWDAAWLHRDRRSCGFRSTTACTARAPIPSEGAPAEAKAIFGGAALGVPDLYSIDYKDADLVRRIASALSKMRDDAVWARAGLVERKDYTGPREHDLQVAVVDEIHALADFYARPPRRAGRDLHRGYVDVAGP